MSDYKKAVARCDELARQLVKARAAGRCECCGSMRSSAQIECSHFIPRTHTALRWREENLDGLCHACHTLFEKQYHPGQDYYAWKASKLGLAAVDELVAMSEIREIPQLRQDDFNTIIAHLRKRIRFFRGIRSI